MSGFGNSVPLLQGVVLGGSKGFAQKRLRDFQRLVKDLKRAAIKKNQQPTKKAG
ncbi:MAG: hypothetical protein Q8P45_02905 [Candidatus Harrisonbacteria bacterium]|nr:hypothetical protein [Candidatus Harrisonbacteria bacterium]